MRELAWAVGLMSGTSLDGLDAALIRTDGVTVAEHGHSLTLPMPADLRQDILNAMHGRGDWLIAEHRFTMENVTLVKRLLAEAGLKPLQVAVIGFHGQTIVHRPAEGITWQFGDGALLAEKTKIDVVNDFRRRDVAAGGEGAPLVPLYHAALGRALELPLAVLNLGGIGNVTWIGRSELAQESITEHDIIAFDTGPGNVLIDEWVRQQTGDGYDEDGRLALAGKVNDKVLARYMTNPYFGKLPPKSLDRHDFDLSPLEGMSAEDGTRTLAAFTAASAAMASQLFPAPAKRWLVTGGGRHNPAIMAELTRNLNSVVEPVESVGWKGDALEAEAFAFLAMRSLARLPLSLPTITGAGKAVTGGALHRA